MVVSDHDLVSFSLLGLHESWKGFQDVVGGRENFLNSETFWADCIQEEIQRGTIEGRSVMTVDEENLALAGKAKGKKGQGEVQSS